MTAVALACFPATLLAQDTLVTCDGLPVAGVRVATERPTFKGAFAKRWRAFARSLGLHHQTTAAGIVRRFVSLDAGRGCTEFRRGESERILRAQPYLADANVTTVRDGDSVRVGVATVDEVPLVIGARANGVNIRALNVGTMNFLGAGMHVEGRWERARGLRQGFGGRISHPQLLGRPYTIQLDGMRRPIGEHFTAGLQHPFYTDLQRIAWHAGFAGSKDFARLRRSDRSELLQPVDRGMWSVGGVVRIGPPRRLGLVGGMVIGERTVPRNEWFTVDSATGVFAPASDTSGTRLYPVHDVVNIASVLGLRALTYSRMAGLDALSASQDVATGTQVGAVVGVRPWGHVPLRESFAAVDAYGAGRSRRNFAAARIEAESRIDLADGDWSHMVASGRAAWYFKPTPRWVSEVSFEGTGIWRPILPLQLELGERRSGVRGYQRSLEPGSQRLIGRLEQRADLMRIRGDRVGLGGAAFMDMGRVWRGEVPFGVTTPIRGSAGVAILAAFPARSQRTMRAEVAIPFTRETGARPELRFTIREPTAGFWMEPDRLRWARLSAVPEQIFTWP